MALMVESGFPGSRAVAIAELSRSTATRSAAETSVMVRDTSVAASIARSATPAWGIGWGVSTLTNGILLIFDGDPMRPPPLAIRARAF
jgi:hypothetical protein